MLVNLDFETRSAINIKACGAYVYAAHPSTDVLCLAVKVDEDPAMLWVPGGDPAWVLDKIRRADVIESHNAQFEREVWRHICHGRWGWPALPEEKLRCSMAKAAMHAMPRGLGDLCVALDLPQDLRKDARGDGLIKKLCVPKTPTVKEWAALEERFGDDPVWQQARAAYNAAAKDKKWAYLEVLTSNWADWCQDALLWNNDREDLQSLYEYCLQDVEAEHAASLRMHDLTPGELEVWRLDQRINQRGVRIDRVGAQHAIDMVEAHSQALTAELQDITNGMVQTAKQNAAIIKWAAVRGVDLPNVQAATVEVYLKRKDLPKEVRRVLEIRASLNRASTAKYKAALNASQTDGKLRGWAVYHGAGTGRWTSSLMQLHNMPRGNVKLAEDDHIDAAYWSMEQGADVAALFYGDPMDLASSSIRGVITADPGHEFFASDFSSVEARKLAWLAGDEPALDVFRHKKDPYKVAAASIFGVPYEQVTKAQRQTGKASELGLGYGGGIGAYASMARVYRVDLETLPEFILPLASEGELSQAKSTAESYVTELDRRIKHGVGNATELDRMSVEAAMSCDVIKQRWRKGRLRTVQFWADLEEAAVLAVQNPGQAFQVGRVAFCVKGEFLLCRLPSGRCLFYFRPHMKLVQKFGRKAPALHYWGMKALDGGGQKYQQIQTYGGKLSENCFTADTEVITARGVLPIVAVLPGDLVWDGAAWVTTQGPIYRGEKEVISWLGVRVTPDHLITDGSSWRSVTASDAQFVLPALWWALSSVNSWSFARMRESTAKRCASVSAETPQKSQPETCGEDELRAVRLAVMQRLGLAGQHTAGTRKLSATAVSSPCGVIDTQEWFRVVSTQITALTQTTGDEESVSPCAGSTTEEHSLNTQRALNDGTSLASILTGSTTKGITAQETSDWLKERLIHETNDPTRSLSTSESVCLSRSFGKGFAPDGEATTPSSTTSTKVKHPRRSSASTHSAAVYDLLNCGPLSRFTIITDAGPLVVHNCTQASCACLLRAAMLRAEEAGYPVVLHVHDEVVAQRRVGEGNLEEYNAIMSEVPGWAEGLPMGASGWVGKRYRKD